MVTPGQINQLHNELTAALSPEGAATMMEIVDPLAHNALATQADVFALRSDMDGLRGEMTGLRGEMAALSADLRGEMAALSADLRGEMAALRADVRSDLTELKSDLSRTFATWLFLSQGVMVAIVGLLLSMR